MDSTFVGKMTEHVNVVYVIVTAIQYSKLFDKIIKKTICPSDFIFINFLSTRESDSKMKLQKMFIFLLT